MPLLARLAAFPRCHALLGRYKPVAVLTHGIGRHPDARQDGAPVALTLELRTLAAPAAIRTIHGPRLLREIHLDFNSPHRFHLPSLNLCTIL